MVEIIHLGAGNITQFLKGTANDGLMVPKPFEQPIYLVDLHVAGTTHVDDIDELITRLTVGYRLKFQREVDNHFDELAIKVMDSDENKLGYIPANSNEILARLMDGGKLLYSEITKIERIGNWNKITMRIFLDD